MKDPAVLFYTADFITGTLTMNYDAAVKRFKNHVAQQKLF